MRTFERDVDRDAQEKTRRCLAGLWGCTIFDRGAFAEVDWVFYKGSALRAFGEFKRRRVTRDTYPSVILCERKHAALGALAERYNVPALYVVRFDDALGYVDASDAAVGALPPVMGGRPIRAGAAHDLEPVRMVPMLFFNWIPL